VGLGAEGGKEDEAEQEKILRKLKSIWLYFCTLDVSWCWWLGSVQLTKPSVKRDLLQCQVFLYS